MESLSSEKFKNGKIYFIGNFIDNDVYIGSSCQSLQKRFQQHKDSMNSYKKNRKLYSKMLELGIEHFYIEEIEKCPCNNIEELRKRERHYIKERQPVLNKQIPLRTEKEWRADNKEHLQEYEKKRGQENKEQLREYQQKYHQENKEKLKAQGKEYRDKNREEILKKKREHHHKNKEKINEEKKHYYQKNRGRFLEKNKKYQEENKERIKARNQEIIQCECGKSHQRCQRSRHLKAKFHQNFLNNNIENELSEETGSNEI